ncbi:MAG: family 43 glycosylhydrolase [Erysipelotrichaceae bacterium]|nr:family 43 glycosylhydrolase [Erysipelotrichaceae bacterium]
MKEYCNPIDIPYKWQHYGVAHREAADPTLVLFKGTYYLFASMSAGFYYSDDLVSWKWHENRDLDMYRYAPDVRQIGDYLYFCASTRKDPSTIWRSKDPLKDDFEKVSEPFAFWDPDLFCDDDGRVYFYWGCGNREPIWGIELDKETMMPIGEKVACFDHGEDVHGWERFNFPGVEQDLEDKNKGLLKLFMKFMNRKGRPYMEGSFMNKWNGKYYLQYAAPGTQFSVYGDGCYVSDKPLGPFKFMPNTPFSLKPSGFITGAGHGSTIDDKDGNIVHVSTMRISVNQNFERRLGLFPAGLDEDGLLFCNQNFADYPIVLPEGKYDSRQLKPQYFLLSYKKHAKASSCLPGHPVELATDENIRTWWAAENTKGWYELDLGDVYRPHSVQINFAENEVPELDVDKKLRSDIMTSMRYIDSSAKLKTRFTLEGSVDGKEWFMIEDRSKSDDDRSHPYIILNEKYELRYLKVSALELPYNEVFALSGLRVFGKGKGEVPAEVKNIRVSRQESGMDALISFDKAEGAFGYNIRFGIAPDKLYTSYQAYEKNEVLLTTLNKGQRYYFVVDSFNENGICEGNQICEIAA